MHCYQDRKLRCSDRSSKYCGACFMINIYLFVLSFRTLEHTNSLTTIKSTRKQNDRSAMHSQDVVESVRMRLPRHRQHNRLRMKRAACRSFWSWTLSQPSRTSCDKLWARQRCMRLFKKLIVKCTCRNWNMPTTTTESPHPLTLCSKTLEHKESFLQTHQVHHQFSRTINMPKVNITFTHRSSNGWKL